MDAKERARSLGVRSRFAYNSVRSTPHSFASASLLPAGGLVISSYASLRCSGVMFLSKSSHNPLHVCGGLLREDFFEKGQRPRIIRLPEPEHGLLPHFAIAIALRDFDQLGHAFVLRQLAQRKYGLLLHVRVRIVFNCAGNRADRFLSGFVRQPEERLPAHVAAFVLVRHANHLFDRSGLVGSPRARMPPARAPPNSGPSWPSSAARRDQLFPALRPARTPFAAAKRQAAPVA